MHKTENVKEAYEATGSVWKAGALLGLTGQQVHARLKKMGVERQHPKFSEIEKERLRREYVSYANEGRLAALAEAMGRTKPFIARQAGLLGLTDRKRKKPYLAESAGQRLKQWHAANEHPRGMLGKKHSPEALAVMSAHSKSVWAKMSKFERRVAVDARRRASSKTGLTPQKRGSWRAGYREVGGKRCFFRSSWEANYARYLEWLRQRDMLLWWEHEVERFDFPVGIARYARYVPDFRVTLFDGSVEYHEVKGREDTGSRLKARRMARYFPDVALKTIGAEEYRSLEKVGAQFVPEWEHRPC